MNNKEQARIEIEKLDQAILDGTVTYEEIDERLNRIADLLGKDANRVFRVPPVEVAPGEFRRGKVGHR